MKRLLFTTCLLCLLCSCQKSYEHIGGVPVKGTIWELASALAERGDGTIIPECVNRVQSDEGYIEGWVIYSPDNQRQCFIRCLIENDQVVEATVHFTTDIVE